MSLREITHLCREISRFKKIVKKSGTISKYSFAQGLQNNGYALCVPPDIEEYAKK
jgi:hypothetical protein